MDSSALGMLLLMRKHSTFSAIFLLCGEVSREWIFGSRHGIDGTDRDSCEERQGPTSWTHG
ncbi:MAG: hypothetical protein HQL65_03900 [Magnetococcales bacterium]|nr:hypothetical protein [Magnetococcales bacterium]